MFLILDTNFFKTLEVYLEDTKYTLYLNKDISRQRMLDSILNTSIWSTVKV